MTYRVYYWIRGASANRPGGPWWYRDFPEHSNSSGVLARDIFIADIKPFLQDLYCMEGNSLPDHRFDPMHIQPCEGARQIQV